MQSIQDLENIEDPSDALAAYLKNKTHLVELVLQWSGSQNPDVSTNERDVIENLQPSKHLEKLSICHYSGTQFPNWLFDYSLWNVVVFDRLASRQVLNFFRGRKLDETLNKLKEKLLPANVVVDDAEQKQFSNSYVKAWLDAVNDAMFDEEDTLNEIDYEFCKCEFEAECESQTCTCKVSNFLNAFSTALKITHFQSSTTMAAEFVGSALLSAFLQVAFDRLASPQVLDFFRERKLDENLLSSLKTKLRSINALADDAEQKQFRDPYVRDWLVDVKEAVFDAEDVLDAIDYQLSKVKAESQSQTCTCKVPNFFNSHLRSFNRKIDSRMRLVLEKLEFLSNQKGDLRLKEGSTGVGVGSGRKMPQKLPSTSLLSESVIYGRDIDREMIINWLIFDVENVNQLSIISIVGMGGLGKTTLAQHVYNDTRMDHQFGIQAWVCVSDEFDVFKVTRTILEAITKSTDDSRDLEMVQGRLKEKLTGKRFFLVLDDIWNENRENWEAVQTPLSYGAQGSRILVTTRSKKVASTMRSTKVHHLNQLQEDHCWQVFAKQAFQDDNPLLNDELKEIGIKIVEKCKGLPLALKTIGSLLHTNSSISEWESVLTSKIWDLPKEDSEIIPALLLSYHHLPSHLKRCFAYCSLFPKDYAFDKKHLILLWMAENFLQCLHQSKSPEEVGEQYFDDLLSRSFFQQSSRFQTRFVMHDLLNDLAKYVCGDIYFRLGIDKAKSIPKITRHFSVAINHVQYFDGFGTLSDTRRLHTFMPTSRGMNFLHGWHCKMSIHELFTKFNFLRVLSLSYCSGLTEVPDSVDDLKHLRSLDLSGTGIKKLPNSICSLYNLQILKLGFCRNLEELPSNLHKLANLRHLEFIGTRVRKLPIHLGKLKNLHVWMSWFDVGKSSEFSIQLLGELNIHGSLSIGELQNIVSPLDALAADLKNKTHLVELELEWNWNWDPDDSRKEREVVENLQPSKHVEKLSIRNYGGTQFPSWLFDNSLVNVMSLKLDCCKYCSCLPPLGLLPFLKHLTIAGLDGIVGINADFYGSSSSSFTSLETLHFSDMAEWEEWECKAVTGAFSRLQHLSIEQCPKLKGNLPEQLLHLKYLVICDCKNLVAYAPRALEIRELELRDCGNLQFDYHPTTLKWLTVTGHNMEASSLEKIEHIISNTSIEFLNIYYCPNMNIPMSHSYDFLVTLKINGGCDSLTIFSLDFFPKLCSLDLRCCNLQIISQERVHNNLKDLNISGCPQFESFPREGLFAPKLERFSIEGLEILKSLPQHMHVLLPCLTSISILDCPQVESFSDGGLPSNLKKMDLSNCSKLITSLEGALGANTSLEILSIRKVDLESFPDEGLLPLSLTSLWIYNCPDLKKLNYKGLCHLSSLEILLLYYCGSLQCLPEEGLPKSISTLEIFGCPLLKQRCQNPEAEDWGKISHIKNIRVAFDRIASRQILDFFRGRELDKTLLSQLNNNLLSIDAVVDDAEQKQIENPHVKAWLVAVKEAVFDAEDVLDDIDYELSKCQAEAESHTNANQVRNFNMEIESRLKQVLDDLEFLASQKVYLGLKETSGASVGSGRKVSQKLPSTSLVVESVIYGRDDDKEIIFNWLTLDTGNHNQLSILSIVGMGGEGKTTLAQHVYNDPRIEGKFDIKVWVCVSDGFDVFKITRTILEAITKSKDKSRNLEMVHGRLKEILTGKRFLLVLDDVWNEDRKKWEVVQTPLNYGAHGSRILVTTRSKKVASVMRSNKIHLLSQLEGDHCWKVLAKHAFQDDNPHLNVELKEIGIKIVERCKGLPLALKTIGSLLHTKSSTLEWKSVLTSEIWELPKEDSEIIPALLLSYHHLPSHLKRCFAYCALFPKDYEFDKECLILLWMAENFLKCPHQSKSPEEVGEQYFDDLLSRSFFQPSRTYEKWFVMHDLLNDLAKYVCGDICFRWGVDKANVIPKTTRYFSLAINRVQYIDGFGSLYSAKRLRTFMPTGWRMNYLYDHWYCKVSIHELFSKFKFLRVLSLSCSDLTEMPDSMGDLKHLCSLDLSGTAIKKLPDSTCSLYNLQILKLSFCKNLEELPLNLYKLTNLRRLEFRDTKVKKMPMHLGKLKNLQVLSLFYVGKSSEFSIQQLGELNLHGRLSIGELQNVQNPWDALTADLKNKIHLEELELEWNQNPDDLRKERDVFENLQPSKHLKKLSIRNYGGTQFPCWLFDKSLSNMVSLKLDFCIYCLCLPPLGLLPFLKHLTITGLDGIVSIGTDFYGSSSSSFTSLETLYLSDMKEWKEWDCTTVKGAFPRLQQLFIVQCPKLKGHLPKQLLRLKKLVIRHCKQLVAFVPRALEFCELDIRYCGKLQFDYHPATLKMLAISGHSMEASTLERIGHILSHTRLELLFIDSCPEMNIPLSGCYDFLINLEINDGCNSITNFPLNLFPKLCSLDVMCCNLRTISQGSAHNHLKDLKISECPQFESFPSEGLSAPWLESFHIEGLKSLKSLPEYMYLLLPSLDNLQIEDCPRVESFPDGGLPTNLKKMHLCNCSKQLIASLKGALGSNPSLETLRVGKVDAESFPDEGLLPLSLTSLEIYNCPDLKKLDYMGLRHLSFLMELVLDDCSSLLCLPEEGLPKSISDLSISGNCPLLKQHWQDWEKIAHIKKVRMNHKFEIIQTPILKCLLFIRCQFFKIYLHCSIHISIYQTTATQ
ncbi:putative disease resistance RPP13-like protein 1, partial [Mucuna pruriens]